MSNELDHTVSDVPAIYDDNLVAMAENAERRIEAIKRIKLAALSVTNANDWTDQGGKPYLAVSGGEKVARLFGISWRIDPPIEERTEDGHFSFIFKGYFSLGNSEIEAIGTRSSRDGFFSTNKGKTLPPSEIDRNDVKKSAYTNCVGNGVTRLLGIRNMTWEDLAKVGISRESVSKIEYKKQEMSEESKDMKVEIRRMILEMVEQDEAQAKDLLEVLTRFTGKDGKQVPGKKSVEQMSEAQVKVTYGKVKKEYEKWQKNQPPKTDDGGKFDGKQQST